MVNVYSLVGSASATHSLALVYVPLLLEKGKSRKREISGELFSGFARLIEFREPRRSTERNSIDGRSDLRNWEETGGKGKPINKKVSPVLIVLAGVAIGKERGCHAMPVGKYYCDYCDKQFQDTHFSRKRHLQGLQHLRARALWVFAHMVIPANMSIPRTFEVRTVSFHRVKLSSVLLCTPRCIVILIIDMTIPVLNFRGLAENKQAAMILGSQLAAGALSQGDVVTNIMGIAWGNLPPSLKPPPEGGYPPLPFLDWG
ncbi:hypothetical protein CDL15_Pgr004044 [Punica granatum]|uniref:U1-type domain-containing protein n=1 Tax=Punica granatum TaxID=22663 RepID=A0A218XEG9_PUNGR|nr:hypothetical protein CDL15_Pgr004044 [Punica granatum]